MKKIPTTWLSPTLRIFQLRIVFMLLAGIYASSAMSAQNCDVPAMSDRPQLDTPTRVHIGMVVADLRSIDDRSQTSLLDLYLRGGWSDPRLAAFAGCIVPAEDIWSPRIEILNATDLSVRGPKLATIGAGGVVELALRYSGNLSTPHDLVAFPFDKHQVTLTAMSPIYNDSEVLLVVDQNHTSRAVEFSIPDWTVGEVAATTVQLKIPALAGASHSVYELAIPVERRANYHLFRVIVPTIMIVLVSWGVFWIPVTQVVRVSVGMTAMLTLFALQFAVSSSIPRVSYLTTMEYITIVSSIAVFLALIEAFSVANLVGQNREADAKRLDSICRIAFPLAYLAIVGGILV